jgi:transposase
MAVDYEAEILKRDQQIAELLGRIQEMEEEIKDLKELLKQKGASKGSKQPKFKLNDSVEGIKRKCQRGKQATGRRCQSEKVEPISLGEAVYPENVEAQACVLHREQSVWRIIEGKGECVCYSVYVHSENEEEPVIAGVRNSRSE